MAGWSFETRIIRSGVSCVHSLDISNHADQIEALAAYHNDYRRQLIDEAAESGEFGEISLAGT